MSNGQATRSDQPALWNSGSGRVWVDEQALVDAMFKGFEELLVEAVSAARARDVLDIGCGTGATTLAIARLLGAQGRCVGIDISEPMTAAARNRAEREGSSASFIRADAQSHAFDPGRFDMIVSRFGVMFFQDPVEAFANLRKAVTDGAALRCIAWRDPADNPFMTTAGRAAAPLLPNMPSRPPNTPGQFGFADRERVRTILEQSGWTEIGIEPLDVACTMPEPDLIRYFTRFGAVGYVIDDVDAATRAEVIATVRSAFEPYIHDGEVRFTAGCWMIAATAPLA